MVHKNQAQEIIWYGHAQRLSNDTPAKYVINYANYLIGKYQ